MPALIAPSPITAMARPGLSCSLLAMAKPSPALIEENNAVMVGIEKPPRRSPGPGARAAVKKYHRNACRIPRLLPVHDMETIQGKFAHLERLDGREQRLGMGRGGPVFFLVLGHDDALKSMPAGFMPLKSRGGMA